MSSHPVDMLVRDIAHMDRGVTPSEVTSIQKHISAASFGRREHKTPGDVQAIVGPHSDSLSIHWAKRVFVEKQWALDVSAEEYLQHLRGAAKHQAARLVIYDPPRGPVVGILAPNAIPPDRLGPKALPFVWVAYGAAYGKIISGYQVSGLNEVTLLGSVIKWLK